jgi:hypothetical protein
VGVLQAELPAEQWLHPLRSLITECALNWLPQIKIPNHKSAFCDITILWYISYSFFVLAQFYTISLLFSLLDFGNCIYFYSLEALGIKVGTLTRCKRLVTKLFFHRSNNCLWRLSKSLHAYCTLANYKWD